jgi:DNA repair ATPase RecN
MLWSGAPSAALRPVADLDPKLSPAIALVDEALIPLKEAGRALADYLDSLEVDPPAPGIRRVAHRLDRTTGAQTSRFEPDTVHSVLVLRALSAN